MNIKIDYLSNQMKNRNYCFILFICLTFSGLCSAQKKEFEVIDNHASSAPADVSRNLDLLCDYLVKPAKNDTEKARSIYVWIAKNIKYDMKGLLSETLPPYDVTTVFKNRLGVCLGMANLYEAMCKKVNITAFVVDGYSKGFGYVDGMKFSNPDHAWNAIYINNHWYHLDVTWDVTSTNLPEYYPENVFTGDFFLVPSDEFIVNHLSSDPVWQLSNYVLPIKDFEKADINISKLESPKGIYISFSDSLKKIQRLDTTDAMIDYARRASDFNPNNSEAKIILSLGYFYKGDALLEELNKLNIKEYESNYKVYEDKINLYYDKAYQVLNNVKPGMKYYDEAKKAAQEIEEYKIKTDVDHSTTLDENYKVNNKFKALILTKDFQMDIKKLDVLNSKARETNLSISPDGKTIFFMSNRGGQPWTSESIARFRDQISFDGDIWYSKRINDKWEIPTCLDNTINTYLGEDEPNISPDGKKLVYQSWKKKWKSSGGPYYIADLKNEKVTNSLGLGGGISRFFIRTSYGSGTDGASMSPDGKRFIVSAGDYEKDLDLFMSIKDKNGKWGSMTPLSLNTLKDERSIFIASDGITIFFASTGYEGFGGLDIFKSTIDEYGNIGEIINLGDKINTTGDDYGFILSATGMEGYFVRDGDIYEIIFKEPIAEIIPGKSLLVKGKIAHLNESKNKFTIKLSDNNKQNELTTTESKEGTYYFFLKNASISYTLSVYSDGKKMAEEKIVIDTIKNYYEITKNFSIDESKKETIIDTVVNRVRIRENIYEQGLFSNIYFKYNSDTISDNDIPRLKLIAKYILEHKNTKLAIRGYSDIRGNVKHNILLSQKRADAAYQFFIKCGIDKKQLIVHSYGSANPLTLDSTIKGGQMNRRVEFKIVNGFPKRNN